MEILVELKCYSKLKDEEREKKKRKRYEIIEEEP